MENGELPIGTITANGPTGLAQVLADLQAQCETNPELANKEHYILYQLGQQRVLIKVDMSQHPYMFWYGDLLSRPVTKAVKRTIADFIWDHDGGKEEYAKMQEKQESKSHE